MTEEELFYAITSNSKKHPGLCGLLGIRWFHVYDSRRCPPGFPDLVLVGARVAYRELKDDTNTLKPDQRAWRDSLRAAGADWGLWRPRDLASGRIKEELAALMGKGVLTP